MYLPNAGASLGYGGLPAHDERYDHADEYLEVAYKLWEGSWEEDAVLRDTQRRRYADPAKIHPINHVGKYYEVAGPHLFEPSPPAVLAKDTEQKSWCGVLTGLLSRAPPGAQHSSEAVSPRWKRHNRRRGQPQTVAAREVAPQCFSLAYAL